MRRLALGIAVMVSLLLVSAGAVPAQEEDASGEVRVIELEADAALRFVQDGEQIRDIPVVPGETVLFRIDNTAGFDHSFWIGTAEELSGMWAETDTGIPVWQEGVREMVWTVPDDLDDLMFGCTVPGHFYIMRGCLSEARRSADGTVEPIGEPTCETVSFAPPAARPSEVPTGSRVELPWARVALTFPPGWDVSSYPEKRSWTWDIPLVADYWDGEDFHLCELVVVKAPFILDDPGATYREQVEQVSVDLGAGQATRTDWVMSGVSVSRYEVTSPDGWHYELECTASPEEVPADRWLSIAETIEFLRGGE